MGLLQEYFYEFELPLLMSTFLGRDTSPSSSRLL